MDVVSNLITLRCDNVLLLERLEIEDVEKCPTYNNIGWVSGLKRLTST